MDIRQEKFKESKEVHTDANLPLQLKKVLYICPSTEPIWVEKLTEDPDLFKKEGYTHICFVTDKEYVEILTKLYEKKGGEYNIQHINDIIKEKEERLNSKIILYRDDRTGQLWTPDELKKAIKDYKSEKVISISSFPSFKPKFKT